MFGIGLGFLKEEYLLELFLLISGSQQEVRNTLILVQVFSVMKWAVKMNHTFSAVWGKFSEIQGKLLH